MIDAVLLFGVMNVLFEFVLLCMMSPRIRLRVLGSDAASHALHFSFLAINLAVHWGTLIGTMSSIFAFISSLFTVAIARRIFGTVKDGRFYTVGLIKYSVEQLK